MKKIIGVSLIAAVLIGGLFAVTTLSADPGTGGLKSGSVNVAADPGTGGLSIKYFDPGTGGL